MCSLLPSPPYCSLPPSPFSFFSLPFLSSQTGELLHSFNTPTGVDSLVITATGKIILGCLDGDISIWRKEEEEREADQGEREGRGEGKEEWASVKYEREAILKHHTKSIYALAMVSRDILASGGEDSHLCFWNVDTHKLVSCIENAHEGYEGGREEGPWTKGSRRGDRDRGENREMEMPEGRREKKGEGRREKREGRREKGEGRREKGEGRREKGEEGRREKGEGRRERGERGEGGRLRATHEIGF
jgi:hypothetical protein